jgi:hypothetical protein
MTSICEKIPMKTKVWAFLFIISILFFASCGRGQATGSTMTSPPTSTPWLTATPIPTQSSTPVSVWLAYSRMPREMMLDQPGYGVEVLGEDWNYTNDRWGETFACIDYTRARQPHVLLEQCFSLTQPNLTLESEREKYLSDNYEVLVPGTTFDNVGQISLMAIRLENKSSKGVKILEFLAVQNYLLRVEMNLATDDTSPLQRFYEQEAADIIDYVLQNMLEKSRLVARPTVTPLPPTQGSK